MPKKRGPNTPEGRAALRLNALKHGLTSRSPVIPGIEDEDDWLRHRDLTVESLAPVGYMEEFLANRIAALLWRLLRVQHYEVAVTMQSIDGTADQVIIAKNYAAGTLSSGELIAPDEAIIEERRHSNILPVLHLDTIRRHETHFHRLWVQTLHELEVLQARRRGEQTHLARLDISSPPAA